MNIHTYIHTNSPTITAPSLLYFLFPSCSSMVSLSLKKLVTCGVIRSFNFCLFPTMIPLCLPLYLPLCLPLCPPLCLPLCFSTHLCVGLLLLILYPGFSSFSSPPPPPPPTLSHTLCYTPSFTHTLLHICHTPSFTHALLHPISFIHTLLHTIFHTHSLSHTQSCHTPSFSRCGTWRQFCVAGHTHFVTHHLFHSHFVTHHLSHTLFVTHNLCHTHNLVTHHLSVGVALGDSFAWQAWQLWHWAGSGGALGPVLVAVTPRHFAWQAWHLVTSTFVLRGRRGTW